ncbi:MAG: FkbM family methyltransferase [Pirellulaceae bacterium]
MLKYLKRAIRQRRLQRAGVLEATDYRCEKLGDWALWPAGIRPDSVIYSFGVGDNIAWDLTMIEQFGARVHAFDPTPASIAWVERQQLPAAFVFHPWGISNFDGTLDFYPPRKAGSTHFTQSPRGIFNRAPPVPGQVYRLQTIMQRLGHQRLDVLKLDVEGSEFEAIPDILASGIRVDQLLVEIHYHFRGRSFRQGLDLIEQVKASGMQCIYVSPRGFEFAFVRRGLEEPSGS